MKISLADLNVIVDTLLGSSSIQDGGNLWKFTADCRVSVGTKLLLAMQTVDLDVEISENSEGFNRKTD